MQEKSIIKKNIMQFIDYKGISASTFYKETGITRGVLGQNNGMNEANTSRFLVKYPEVDANWLFTGQGEMLKKEISTIKEPSNEYQSFASRTDRVEDSQMIPLYDLDAVAGIIPVINDINKQKPVDHIYIPNAPKCDGAMYATGDSMYPLLKSGDILAFKIITDLINDVFFGEMYILFIEVAGDLFRTVKFVHKGDDKDFFKLVSQNKHHQDKDVHISKIKAMAQVKASIRVH